MKTLRAKLFVSMGIILVIVSLLSYVLPEFLVKEEIDKASGFITEKIDRFNKKILKISSFLITYKNIENLAELHGISDMISYSNRWTSEQGISNYTLAAELAAYNPQITFVQIVNQAKEIVVATPYDATLYFPSFAPLSDKMLWIQIPSKSSPYLAVNILDDLYLLFDTNDLKKINFHNETKAAELYNNLAFAAAHLKEIGSEKFTSLKQEKFTLSSSESIEMLYGTVLHQELLWVEKTDLIRSLSRFMQEPLPLPLAGTLKMDPAKTKIFSVLTKEVFSKTPLINNSISIKDLNHPFLFAREAENQTNLDIVNIFDIDNHEKRISLGLSLSETAQTIAESVQKTVILYKKGAFALGYHPDGAYFDPIKEGFPISSLISSDQGINWHQEDYIPYSVPLKEFTFYVLIPKQEASELTSFFARLKVAITLKTSLNLIVAAIVSFVIALLLLSRVSKKITRPIEALVNSFKRLQKGEYSHLSLSPQEEKISEISTLADSFTKLIEALKNKEKIRGVLNKVVSSEIADAILKSSIELGGEEKTITMFFSDIRGFTHLSEDMEPTKLISLLNSYMTKMCAIIDETHGVVDKFVGDEIMALYGAPLPLENHAAAAIQAAIDTIAELKSWNEEQKRKNEIPLECGIGIHTGLVFAGNMGAEKRMNYTVIGANVNLAARLCSQAKPMQILISEETLLQPSVKEKFKTRPLEPVSLKGFDKPIQIYEVLIEE